MRLVNGSLKKMTCHAKTFQFFQFLAVDLFFSIVNIDGQGRSTSYLYT